MVPRAVIDFHSHLIPAVDDGAPDLTHSLAALRAFAQQGVRQCVTTPHFDGSLTRGADGGAARLAALDAGWALLTEAVAAVPGLPTIARGVEVMLDVPDPDLSDARLRLAGTRAVLVEFPAMRVPPNGEWALMQLVRAGWRPVLAHPERYRNVESDLRALARCRVGGVAFQVNAGSLLGFYGEAAARQAVSLLKLGWVDFISSDHHARGEPATARAVEWMIAAGGAAQAARLTEENPARLLADEAPLPVAPLGAKEARSWWARLFNDD